MIKSKIYDIIGIGVGPFNLGLAALLQDHPAVSYLFLEQRSHFNWHPGLLLPWARMQVPYYADLVTLANPQSPFSYINYLHQQQRLLRFGAQENIFPLRIEYNHYCQWVAAQLPNLLFNHRCQSIAYDPETKYYSVEFTHPATGNSDVFHTKHIVVGTGIVPHTPASLQYDQHSCIIHSSDYLLHKNKLLSHGDITVIGSGQSAAEIFYDLLQQDKLLTSLRWYTRSSRIAPMDYSRFALEMATPNYIQYFHGLPEKAKTDLLASQHYLYKGINANLITQIHDQLYLMEMSRSPLKPDIYTSSELQKIKANKYELMLTFKHRDMNNRFKQATRAVILATGYEYKIPTFLEPLHDHIHWTKAGKFDVAHNYTIDSDQTIFVQNAELHSHGFNSADLGLGPYRNAVILNNILGREHYIIERDTTFQSFGPF